LGFQRHRNAAQVPSLACEVQLAGPRAGRSASPNAQVHQFALYAPPILSLRGLVALGPWLRLLGVLNPQSVPMNVLASTWWVCCSGGGSYSFNGKAGMRNHGSSVRSGPGRIMHWLRDLDQFFRKLGLVLSFTGPARVTNTPPAAVPTRTLFTSLAHVIQRGWIPCKALQEVEFVLWLQVLHWVLF